MSVIVERVHEVNRVVGLWKKICRGDSNITFCEFYGIPGIGKTELAKQVSEKLKSEGALCAHLDFDPIQNPWGSEPTNEEVLLYYDQPERLFKDLLSEWNYLDSPVLRGGLYPENRGYGFVPRQFAKQVVDILESLPSEKTVVLICDGTDHIQWERLSWFEKDLIVPLIQSDRCLIIWLGKKKKQWSAEATAGLSQVKTKIEDPSVLDCFSPSEIAKQAQIEKLVLSEEQEQNLRNWLYRITHGLPMAVEIVMQHYSQENFRGGDFEEDFEVVSDIAEQVVGGYILRDNLLQFDEVLRLSLLRINEVRLLRALDGNPSEDSMLSYGRLSIELSANPLSGFPDRLIEQSVASCLLHYYRIVNPNEFLEKEDALLQECLRLSNLAEKGPWSKFVVESIYHAACANMVSEKYILSEIIEEHFRNLRSSEFIDDPEVLISNLENDFRRDNELGEIIGGDGIDQLIAILDDGRKQL